jgi:hypothetical protein
MRSSVSKRADGTQRGTYPCQNFAESQPTPLWVTWGRRSNNTNIWARMETSVDTRFSAAC